MCIVDNSDVCDASKAPACLSPLDRVVPDIAQFEMFSPLNVSMATLTTIVSQLTDVTMKLQTFCQ